MKHAVPIHPFLFSFFVISAPLVNLLFEYDPFSMLRFFLASVLLNLAAMGIGWLITRDLARSAFLCSLIWISIGLASIPLLVVFLMTDALIRATWAALWGLWFLVFLLFARKKNWEKKSDPDRVTKVLNGIGVASILFPLYMLTATAVHQEQWKSVHAQWIREQIPEEIVPITEKPDIYYIILDGYAREDVLREMYGGDNGSFLEELSDLGFYVADDTHSNYFLTIFSLASALNLDYLDERARQWGEQTTDRKMPEEMIHHSLVQAFLESRGYRTVEIASGFFPTEMPDADERLGYSLPLGLNPFEQYWVWHTPFQILIPDDEHGQPVWGYAAHRERILNAFENLIRVSAEAGPKFVFAHLLVPHPPFVLAADGSPIEADRRFMLNDADNFEGSPEEYYSGYAGQVAYTNRRILEVVRAIQGRAQRPAVIILQGDHGPRLHFDFDAVDQSCLWEGGSILNAYYLPEEFRSDLYPSITPVNTFRMIFREIFGLDYPPLEDRVYYSTRKALYRMLDVTGRISEKCSA